MNQIKYYTMFGVYSFLLISLLLKSCSQKQKLHIPTKVEIIQYNYDEPKDFIKDSNLTDKQRQYYEYLVNEK